MELPGAEGPHTGSVGVAAPTAGQPVESRLTIAQLLMEAATPVHYLSLVVALPVLLYLDRDQWFTADVFEFFSRMQPGQELHIFISHGGHWLTIPFLITLPIFKVFGLRSILPYNAVNIVLHLVVTHLLWRWMRRLGADPWIATALAGVFLFVGGGSEALASWFQMQTALAIALGLLGAMVVDHGDRGVSRDLLYWPFGMAAVMCSEVAVAMVVLAALVALLRRGWLAALRVTSVPAVAYLLWLAVYGRQNFLQQPAPSWELTLIPQDIWTGITHDVDATTGLAGGGAVLLIALGAWMFVRRRQARGKGAFAFAAVGAGLFFFLEVGVDRLAAGPQGFTLGRYGYVFVATLIPVTALALVPLSRHVAGRVLVVSLSVLMAVNGVGQLESVLHSVQPINDADRAQILAAAHLVAEGAPLAVGDAAYPEPVNDGALDLGLLRSLIRTGALPMSTPVSPTDTLNAALRIQVSVTNQPLIGLAAGSPTVAASSLGEVTPAGGAQADCLSVASPDSSPQVQLVFSSPGYVELTAGAAGQLGVQLSWAQTPETLTAETATFPIDAGQAVYLNVTAAGVAPVISLPAGVDLVCGAST